LSGGDLNGHIYPIHSFLATSLQNGELPLWNPYMFCGFPQFAEMKTGVFYPLHWVLPLMVTDGYLSYRGYEIFSVFHAFLMGAFTFLLVNYLFKNPVVALFASIAFEFNGYVSLYYNNPVNLMVITWMPLTFLFVVKSIKETSFIWAILSGFSMAMSFMGGYFEEFIFIFYFVSIYFVANAIYYDKLEYLYFWAIFVCVTIGTTAIQWIPTLELSLYGADTQLSYADPASNLLYSFLNPSILFTTFFPKHHEWGGTIYIGIITFILVMALPLIWKQEMRIFENFNFIFLASAAMTALLLSMGKPTILYTAFYLLLPGISYGRYPIHFSFIFVFCISILSAYGLLVLLSPITEEVKEKLRKYTNCMLLLLLALAVITFYLNVSLAFTKKLDPAVIDALTFMILMATIGSFIIKLRAAGIIKAEHTAPILIFLLVFDLFSHSTIEKYAFANPPSAHYKKNELVEYLQSEATQYRVRAVNFSPAFPDGVASVHAIPVDFGFLFRLCLEDYLLFIGHTPSLCSNYSEKELAFMKLPEDVILNMLNIRYVIK